MSNPASDAYKTLFGDPQALTPEQQAIIDAIPAAKSVSDEMMDLVDRLGSEAEDVDPRAWEHLMVYAPQNPRFTMAEWTAHARKHRWRFDIDAPEDGVATEAKGA